MADSSEEQAGIYAITTDPAVLNSYLIVGTSRALLVDTGSGPQQAARILKTARTVTSLPISVLNTHDHWDHFFGNARMQAEGVDEFLASERFAHDQAASAWLQLAEVPAADEPDLPADPTELIVEPTRIVAHGDTIDLGRTVVTVREYSGHTESDIVLQVSDVLIVGDLIEEGAPPQFGDDAQPSAWAQTLRDILAIDGISVYCPGHGEPVDRAFVQAQADDVAAVAAQLADPDAGDAEVNLRQAQPFTYLPSIGEANRIR